MIFEKQISFGKYIFPFLKGLPRKKKGKKGKENWKSGKKFLTKNWPFEKKKEKMKKEISFLFILKTKKNMEISFVL